MIADAAIRPFFRDLYDLYQRVDSPRVLLALCMLLLVALVVVRIRK